MSGTPPGLQRDAQHTGGVVWFTRYPHNFSTLTTLPYPSAPRLVWTARAGRRRAARSADAAVALLLTPFLGGTERLYERSSSNQRKASKLLSSRSSTRRCY